MSTLQLFEQHWRGEKRQTPKKKRNSQQRSERPKYAFKNTRATPKQKPCNTQGPIQNAWLFLQRFLQFGELRVA